MTNTTGPDREDVRRMFDRIAPRYDLANRILSFHVDSYWRHFALKSAHISQDESWLDIATGTGDMVQTGKKISPGSKWYGIDPSRGMLLGFRQRKTLQSVPLVQGQAEFLPYSDNCIHGVTIAFGLRNFSDREKGLREIHRVLVKDGSLVILEFHPKTDGKWSDNIFANTYLNRILPFLGGLVSGDVPAYKYLNTSSRHFWTVSHLHTFLKHAGFHSVKHWGMMAKAVTLTIARKE